MRKQSKRKSASIVIGLLAFSWFCYFIARLCFPEPVNNNLSYVPKNADNVMVVDARKIVGNAVFSLLFENKSSEMVQRIRTGSKNIRSKKSLLNLGINTLTNVVVFTTKANETDSNYLGLIFNLSTPAVFDRNLAATISSNQIGMRKGNVGLLLTSNTQSARHVDKIKMRQYATNLFNSNQLKQTNSLNKNKNNIARYAGKLSSGPISEIAIDLNLNKNSISFDGIMELSAIGQTQIGEMKYDMKPNGFQVGTSLITQEISDTIKKYVAIFGINLTTIQSVLANYRGFNVGKSERLLGFPRMDLLIELKNPFQLKDLAKDKKLQDSLGIKITNNEFTIYDVVYFIKQIDDRTIYIGQDKNPDIQKSTQKSVVTLSGDLGKLTTIEGKGLVVGIISGLPAFKASKSLFDATENIQIACQKNGKNELFAKGEILFKDDKSVLIELINFMLIVNAK